MNRSALHFSSCWKHSDPRKQNFATTVSMRLLIVFGLVFCAAVITANELAFEKYLVADVSDDKLTSTPLYCEGERCDPGYYSGTIPRYAPQYARLNATGEYTSSWSALTKDWNQYIQVDFGSQKWITGIVLLARGSYVFQQWVEKYRVLTSADCIVFNMVKDTNGNNKIFMGNTGLDEEVVSLLDTPIKARCVRINPTSWHGEISLRFDVIGLD